MAWIHLCTISEYHGAIGLSFIVDLQRGQAVDQLRTTCFEARSHVEVTEFPASGGTDYEAAIAAISRAIEAGVIRPLPNSEPGLLSAADVRDVVDAYFAKREVVDAAARARPSDIVATAERLGLSPRPTGTDETSWRAWCPGGKHSLHIQAHTELFYCGYCGANGGPGELEGFTAAPSSHAARRLTERKPHGPQ